MSRSLVGSSSSSTLGSGQQQAEHLEAAPLAAREVADPCGEPVAGEAEPLEHRARRDLAVADPGDPADRLHGRRAHPAVGVEVVELLAEVLEGDRPPGRPARRRLELARDQPEDRGLPGAVDAHDADAVAGTEAPGGVGQQLTVARTRSTSLHVDDVLPSRWVANRWSSIRSRGGDVLDERVGGIDAELRLRGPGRRARGASQASSLRTRFCRRASDAAAWRCRSAFGQHERGVTALVGVDHAVIAPPRPLAHRVEEPAVVGDHHQRRWPVREVLGQPGDGLDVEVVGRLVQYDEVVLAEQQRRERAAAALTSGQAEDRRSKATPASSSSTTSRVRGRPPTRGRSAPEHRLADRVGVLEPSPWWR